MIRGCSNYCPAWTKKPINGFMFLAMVVAGMFAIVPAVHGASKVVISSFGGEGTTGGNFLGPTNSPRGVAVNPNSGEVYVADFENARIQQFDADGVFVRTWGFDVVASGPGQSSEIQRVTVNANAGNFILKFGAGGPAVSETAEIPATASAAEVESALNEITNVSTGGGSVSVTGGPGNAGGATPYFVTFDGGPLAGINVADMTAASGTSPLSGGSGGGANTAVVVIVSQGGAGFEICEEAQNCKAGTPNNAAGGIPQPIGIGVNPSSGDVYVTSSNGGRVAQYAGDGEFIRTWGFNVTTAGPGNVTPVSAVQTVKVSASVTEGSFTLTFAGRTTGPLAWNAPTATVQTALRALAPLATPGTNVNVTGTPRSGATEGSYTITFAGQMKNSPMPPITADSAMLIGGAAEVLQTTEGVSGFEICNKGVDVCAGADTARVNGGFSLPRSLAVDPVTGNVLVHDLNNVRVQMFTDSGAFVGAIGWNVDGSAPAEVLQMCPGTHVCLAGTPGSALGQLGSNSTAVSSLAIDSDHNVFALDFGNKRVQRLEPSGPIAGPTSYAPSAFGPSGAEANPFAVAIDPSTDHVLVGRRSPGTGNTAMRIERYNPAGALQETMAEGSSVGQDQGASEAETNGAGAIAAAPSMGSGNVYLAVPQASALQKVFIINNVDAPACQTLAATEIGAKGARFNGIVTPPGFETKYHFEYSKNGFDWINVPVSDMSVGSGTDPVPVTEPVVGLEPNTLYQVRLFATTGNPCEQNIVHFTTLSSPPDVRRTIALPVGGDIATLNSEVNPNNSGAVYRFEWGTTTAYGNNAPVETEPYLGAGGGWIAAKAGISGLEPATTYHFRIVASGTSGTGVTFGPDATFTTSACVGVNKDGLPDCRAAELVSPPDKGPVGEAGARLLTVTQLIRQISADGAGTVYPISFGLPNSTAGGDVSYRARRGPSGWRTEQLTPPALVPSIIRGEINIPGAYLYHSEDLACSIIASFEPLTGAESENETAEQGYGNLFRRNEDGSYDLLTHATPTNLGVASTKSLPLRAYSVVGADVNCDHVIIETPFNYPGVNGTGFYEISEDAGLVNAGVIDGTSGAQAATSKAGFAGTGGNALHAVSESTDDRRVYFEATSAKGPNVGKAAIFLREDADVGVDVTQTQGASPNDGTARYQAATPDGEHVFFTARSNLAPSPVSPLGTGCTQASGVGCSLYAYDAENESLTDLSIDSNPADTDGPGVRGVVAASDDGSSVYFVALGQIVLGQGRSYAENKADGRVNMYLHRDGVVRFVTNVPQADLESESVGMITTVNGRPQGAWRSRVTPDGSRLVFLTRENVVGYDSGGVPEAYIYDADADVLACVSCRTDGKKSVGDGNTEPLVSGGLGFENAQHPPRSLSNDGRRVFFSMPDALAPGAIDGANNIYEWSEGNVYLLATTQPGWKSVQFAGASETGDDVFIVSQSPLSPVDVDRQFDIYDMRVDGSPGVAPQPPSVCNPLIEGSCAGPAAPPTPIAPAPLSSTLFGQGNVVEPPATKAKHKKKAKGKKKGKKGKGKGKKGKGKGKKGKAARHSKSNGRASK